MNVVLDELARRLLPPRDSLPFEWVVEHLPGGTLDDVWRRGENHVDNISRLDLLYRVGNSRRSRNRWRRAVLAVVAADGATVNDHYAQVVPRLVSRLAAERRRHSSWNTGWAEQLVEQIRNAALDERCGLRDLHNERQRTREVDEYYEWSPRSRATCFGGSCPRHQPHLEIASLAARTLRDYSFTTRLLDEVSKNVSESTIRRAILAAAPTVPMEEILAPQDKT